MLMTTIEILYNCRTTMIKVTFFCSCLASCPSFPPSFSPSFFPPSFSMFPSLFLSFFLRYMLLLLILFFIPGVVMIVAYGLISRELYRGMKFELDQNRENSGETPTPHVSPAMDMIEHLICFLQIESYIREVEVLG